MSRIMGRRCHLFYKEKEWGRFNIQLDITLCRMVGSGALTEFYRLEFGPHHGGYSPKLAFGAIWSHTVIDSLSLIHEFRAPLDNSVRYGDKNNVRYLSCIFTDRASLDRIYPS